MSHSKSNEATNAQDPSKQHDMNQYYGQPYPQAYPQSYYPDGSHLKSWFNFKEPSYVKGFAVGAGVALILTNPAVKKALVKGVVKVWGGFQGGVEELKEQIRDVQAEMGGE